MNIPTSRKDIAIQECLEPLIDIPNNGRFILTHLHPYQALGAPYNRDSPFKLRESVLISLLHSADILHQKHSGYKLRIFDAYRPLAVQEFMVLHTAQEFCSRVYSILLDEATEKIQEEAMTYALGLFAKPDYSLDNPPPHSTGAAIDLTIVDEKGKDIPMGSEIDEVKNARPDAFQDSLDPQEILFHKNRMLLKEIMEASGFVQLPHEWWHFSQGDQNAVLIQARQSGEYSSLIAKYGRFNLKNSS